MSTAGHAVAADVKGNIQLQYQSVESQGRSRSFLNRTFEIDHATQIRAGLDLRSRLELRQLSVMNGPEEAQNPRGSMQLAGRFFGLNGSYRPTRQTDGTGFRSEFNETTLGAYLAKPDLPRLDLNWTRRGRTSALSTKPTIATTRLARVARDFGRLSVRGGYGDITEERQGNVRTSTQRNYDAGATIPLLSGPVASFMVEYGFLRSSTQTLSPTNTVTWTHSGSAVGGLKLSSKTDVSTSYNYRRSEVRSLIRSDVNDHDGTLLLNYRPTSGIRLAGGGGVHTARTAEREDLLKNAILTASAAGTVRPGWTGQAGAAHSVNWFPGGRAFSVDSWNAGSRFRLARRLESDVTLNMTANGDTAAADRKDVAQAGYGFTGYPLRSTRIAWRGTIYRAGSSFTTAPVRSSSNSWELRWTPFRGLEVGGNISRTRALPQGENVVTNRQYNFRWGATSKFQLDVNYLKSDQLQSNIGGVDLAGRESVNARLLLALGRLTRVSAAFNTADPGKRTETRQVDVILTRNFGR